MQAPSHALERYEPPRQKVSGEKIADFVIEALVSVAVASLFGAAVISGMTWLNDKLYPTEEKKMAKARAAETAKIFEKMIENGRRPFRMEAHELEIAADLVYPSDISVTFSMIGGLDEEKQEIFDLVCLPIKRPDLFVGKGSLARPPKGVLLYGPPGTGKTMMAKAIAKESGAAFINLKLSTTMNMWFGESQKLIRSTFSLAWKLAPCVIFVDEIDAFLSTRNDSSTSRGGGGALSTMQSEFMSLWDGINLDEYEQVAGYGVVVIGATNRPWAVDPAILRRMPRQFELGLPSREGRLHILRLLLSDENISADVAENLDALAGLLGGYSGSDIKELCRAAVGRPIRDLSQSLRKAGTSSTKNITLRQTTFADFEAAMESVRRTGEAAREYKQSDQLFGSGLASTARNVSGHKVYSNEEFLGAFALGYLAGIGETPPNI